MTRTTCVQWQMPFPFIQNNKVLNIHCEDKKSNEVYFTKWKIKTISLGTKMLEQKFARITHKVSVYSE